MIRVAQRARGTLLILGLACALLGSAALADNAWRYVASPALAFEYHGQPDLRMPTAVTVAEDGTVYVVDGVRDRILVFAPSGEFREEIVKVGEQPLARPISAKVDRAGVLWIADTGNGRVVARAPDGSLLREIVCPTPSGSATAPEVTDVAVSGDGRTVWLADNHNHHLVKFDLETKESRFLGGVGEALGQFYHPFMLAADAAGDVLLVSEPVGGRVQVYNAQGQAVSTLGTFGVDVGDLYRPKGIAVDGDGNVWVADGTMGVIQVFAITGNVLDMVRDATGAPLKLDMPCGIALDRDGNLYVAELTADRVRKFTIQVNPQAPVQLPSPAARVGGPAQPRACTVCHLEWMEPLARGESTLLLSPPSASPEQPYVSRPETCLSCHDGAVLDSRRLIWVEHGHRTGLAPPPTMAVPPSLPLVEGRIMCRTCHSAHGAWPGSGNVATAIFLRTPNPASELCVSCHANMAGGREAGMHPTGGMPWPVPEGLVKAGAKTGPNPRELTCQACHRAHGAVHEYLLVLGTESNQLCVTCHAQMRPGMFVEGGQAVVQSSALQPSARTVTVVQSSALHSSAEHPLSPVVNAAQAAAVREMGTTLGPGDRLICLSCHELHHAKGQQFLLAENLMEGTMCLRCHENRRTVLDTLHDLRQNFPAEQDRRGLTAQTGGPCSACHLFHEYARTPEASAIDPGGGKCITCHQAGGVAQAKVLGTANHPTIGCTQCHDPHSAQCSPFLRNAAHVVCSSCHAEQNRLDDGPHALARAPTAWPAVAAATRDACLACHRPHGSEETGIFRAGYVDGVDQADGACVACHPGAAPDSTGVLALLHPRDAARLKGQPHLPLIIRDDTKYIACRTCHNPHSSGAADPALLRTEPEVSPQTLCFLCHGELAHIGAVGHAAQVLQGAGFAVDVCGPCHVLHDKPEAVELPLMWPQQLAYPQDTSQPVRAADRHCVACHRVGGPVAPPAIATHPPADMFNPTPPDAPGFLPLFNDRGEIDPQGTIACRTCHLTHGRSNPAPVPPELGKLTARELRAREWHIRSIGSDSVCMTCHGFDALRRFMYFHDPARRGGPLQS